MEGIKVSGEWIFRYSDGIVIRRKNLITLSGLNMLAALLVGEQQNSIPFHLAIGTGATAPASTDAKLQAEAFRKIVSAKTRQGNVAKLRTFLLPTEANGSWTEFGIFMAGTDQADSGTLLNRLVPMGGVSKTSNQSLTIEVKVTFSAG